MSSIGRLALACVTALVLASAASGCGGHGRASFEAGVYRDGAVHFQVPAVPAGWRAIEVSNATLAFRDDPNAATVLLNARCLESDGDTPLVALTNHLVIGFTEREVEAQAPVPFDQREALHTKMRAKFDGVPMALDVFVLKKDGCIYDFVYMGAPERFAEGAARFESFVRGFRTLPGSGVAS